MLKIELACGCGATLRLEMPDSFTPSFKNVLNVWRQGHLGCATRPLEPVKASDSGCHHRTTYSDTWGTHCADCGARLGGRCNVVVLP